MPKGTSRFLEDTVRELPQVQNAMMLESHACLMIQLVDVLMGCVTYRFRQKLLPKAPVKQAKAELSDYLMASLGKGVLPTDFTVKEPIDFSVWQIRA